MARQLPGLRGARKRAGLSQRALEERSGVSYVQVSRIENGQAATPETVQKLAWALGVGTEELYAGGEADSETAARARALGLEPEPYFAEISVENEKAMAAYEVAYLGLLAAERRAHRGTPDLFDSELDGHVSRLVSALKGLPPGEDRERLRERARRIARRSAAVLEQEAVRLESEAEALRAAHEQRLREADLEFTGAA